MGRHGPGTRRQGAVAAAMAVVVATVVVLGVARSEPASAGLARVDATVCMNLDLSVAISVDAAALIDLGDATHDHIGAFVRFRTDLGAFTDWQRTADSAARRFDAANGHHFDDVLVVAPVAAAVAVQVRIEALGPWSDGTLGGIVELPWTDIPDCGQRSAPVGGLLDLDADVDVDVDGLLDAEVDADVDLDGLIDLDTDVDADIDLDLDPVVPVPPVSTPPLPVPPVVPVPPVTTPDDLLDVDLDLELILGPVLTIPVGVPLPELPVPPTPVDDSVIGVTARVRCGVGLDADIDLVLTGRPNTPSTVVVTHPDSLLDIDLDLGAGTTEVVNLTDVLLGHRVLDLLVDGVALDVVLDLACPVDLSSLLTPVCTVLGDGLAVHLDSEIDAALGLLLGVEVLDPVTGATATAALHADASVDLWLPGGDGTVLEVHVTLLGIDLSFGLLNCRAPNVVVPPTTTPTTTPTSPTTAPPVTTPNSPTTTTPSSPTTTTPTATPTTTTPTGNPTTTTPSSSDPDDPDDPDDPTGPSVSPAAAAPAQASPAALGNQAPAGSTTTSGSLPVTGAGSLALATAAAALLAGGLVMVQLARRRGRAHR